MQHSAHYAQAYNLNPIPARPVQNARQGHQRYQPGSIRCSQPQCPFVGLPKVVEIHLMDRHLVFPPGWRPKPTWDADPSLKGKPVAIQGVGIVLDSPEVIDQWIEERRRRWPSRPNVEEKQQNYLDALERGLIVDPSLHGKKRRKLNNNAQPTQRPNSYQRRGQQHQEVHRLPKRPPVPPSLSAEEPGADSDSDMDPEKDAVSSKAPQGGPSLPEVVREPTHRAPPPRKPLPPKPKEPRPGLFDDRPSLLRKLLQPEIRVTVSNLSQAIRFIVANDFFDNVEMKPGDGQGQPKVEVISETYHTTQDMSMDDASTKVD